MTVWSKVENEVYAVAIYNWEGLACAPSLPLELGELVAVERECHHWYYGRSLRRDACGVFPKSYVAVRDATVDCVGAGDAAASAGGPPLAHEIALTLRDWLQHWKRLYLTDDRKRFELLEVCMRTLVQKRAEMAGAAGALPADRLRRVARTAVFTIDKGNRALGAALCVRDATGAPLDPRRLSTWRLNALHQEADARIDRNMEPTGDEAGSAGSAPRCYSVLVFVDNFVCKMADDAELLLALHGPTRQLTEPYLVRWARAGLPADIDHVHNMRVLFTDLSLDDIKKEKLYLVCYVVRIGAMEPQNMDHRRSSMSGGAARTPPVDRLMRRPFGVACADLSRVLATPDHHSPHTLCVPFYPCERDNLDTTLKKLMANRAGESKPDTRSAQGLWVRLQLLAGDLRQLGERAPAAALVAHKMGFPEVVLPGDARNDLYVTLVGGAFSRGGGKSSERNIELSARVIDKAGNTLPGVISVGAGAPLADEYVSLVYYHEDRPRWQEVFKVCLPIDAFKEAHLAFLCRHRSSNEAKDRAERPFALAYVRLLQRDGTTLPDRTHTLAVYKIEARRWPAGEVDAVEEAVRACLALPAHRDDLPPGAERGLTRGPLALVHRDSLTVATALCSTKLTQSEEILGVLKWVSRYEEGTLRAALARLLQVPSDELFKFLQDILDALFNILTQVDEQLGDVDEGYGGLVLACLMRVIALVGEHKFQHFQPVLHVYIDESFCHPLAYEKLLAVVRAVVLRAEEGELALKKLLQCMKCLEFLIRFVVRSRELRAALADDAPATATFQRQFRELFEALTWLMARGGDAVLTSQGSCLKYLPHAVPHILRVYSDTDLASQVVGLLYALPAARLTTQRVLLLLELVRGPLCARPAPRRLLVPHLARTLHALLRDHIELELCVTTLGELLAVLARDDVGPTNEERGVLAAELLPALVRLAADAERDRHTDGDEPPLLRAAVAVLLDLLRDLAADQYTRLGSALTERGGPTALRDLLAEALALGRALVARPVFRAHWADMLHLQSYVLLDTLRLFSVTLLESFLRPTFDRRLWTEWFDAVVELACASPLQVERLAPALRKRLLVRYGDLRHAAARLLRDCWFNLGEYKRVFIPGLVGPLLEMSLLPDEEVRRLIIPLFFDMMQCEYDFTGHFRELENEIIDKLDTLVEGGRGDHAWRALFVSLVGALCASHSALREPGSALVAAVGRQLDTLLDYTSADGQRALSHKMHHTTRVLEFYKEISRPHMYIRYVHKLVAMHRTVGQWAEAGLALRLHATLLSWSDEPVAVRLRPPADAHPGALTQRQLKEALYLDIAEYLHEGKLWELAVEAVKELVGVYEREALGYAPLAELHAQLARLYRAVPSARPHPGYFRVLYHGRGFPDHLRAPYAPYGFVYRGHEFEMLHDFAARLLAEWPDAELLPRLDPPEDDITHSGKQYVQVNAVEPVPRNSERRLSGKPAAAQVLAYHKHNNVDTFIFSRPFFKQEESSVEGDAGVQNEFATRWLERTELEISDKLPGILRWFPVVRSRTFELSPLEVALETMRDTNRELRALVLEHRAHPDIPLDPLTRKLSGIVDAAVMGGVENYERAFFTPAYVARRPTDAERVARLKDLIAEQVPLLEFGLEVHRLRAPTQLEPLHARLMHCFQQMRDHVHANYGRKTCDLVAELGEVRLRRRPLAESPATPPVNSRLSDAAQHDSHVKSTLSRTFLTPFNQLTRNSASSGSSGHFGTLHASPPKRRDKDKRRARKSEVGSGASSQWYTSGSDAASPGLGLRELRQELSASRPLRADAERERRASQPPADLPPSERNSIGTTDSNQDDEESAPPPLPLKTTRVDRTSLRLDSNDNEIPPPAHVLTPNEDGAGGAVRYNYDLVVSARGSFLYSSLSTQRGTARHTTEGPRAPTPPPKARHRRLPGPPRDHEDNV